jgi:hypothetical protein
MGLSLASRSPNTKEWMYMVSFLINFFDTDSKTRRMKALCTSCCLLALEQILKCLREEICDPNILSFIHGVLYIVNSLLLHPKTGSNFDRIWNRLFCGDFEKMTGQSAPVANYFRLYKINLGCSCLRTVVSIRKEPLLGFTKHAFMDDLYWDLQNKNTRGRSSAKNPLRVSKSLARTTLIVSISSEQEQTLQPFVHLKSLAQILKDNDIDFWDAITHDTDDDGLT